MSLQGALERGRGDELDAGSPRPGLHLVEVHEVVDLHRELPVDAVPEELAGLLGGDGEVVGVLAGHQLLDDLLGLLGAVGVLHEVPDDALDLGQRLPGLLGEDQGLVIDLVHLLLLQHLEDARRGVGPRGVPELRVDRAQDGVGGQEDLVSGQGDEGAPAHGVVGDHHRGLRGVGVQGVGDLGRREGDAPWGVDDYVDGSVVGGEPDRPEDGLAVVYVDVPGDGEAEEAHGLLAVDDGDHVGAPLPPKGQELVPPGTVKGPLAESGP